MGTAGSAFGLSGASGASVDGLFVPDVGFVLAIAGLFVCPGVTIAGPIVVPAGFIAAASYLIPVGTGFAPRIGFVGQSYES